MQTQARTLTDGPITPTLLRFALPMMLGNLLQLLYNIADTLIVGRYVGADALAAVGAALYPDDLPHLHSAGPFHGQRCGGVHLLRAGGYFPHAAGDFPFPVHDRRHGGGAGLCHL